MALYYNFFMILLISCMASIGGSRNIDVLSRHGPLVNVMRYGAIGNGQNDDTRAFMEAWKVVCDNGLTLYIPRRRIFLLSPISFEGPCKSNVNVKVGGELIAPDLSSWSGRKDSWITFTNINGLFVTGGGTFNGNGLSWWKRVANEGRPTALKFNHCSNVNLTGVKHKDSPRNHISISSSENVEVSRIHITAPETSPNTDGIDISHSTHINIKNSFIGTGDDCIAINGGTSFVNISSISCGPGHGISVGSLGKYGAEDKVEEIYVRDSTFDSTQNGVRIKTWEGGSGYARKIHFHNITFFNTENPVIIDQQYCPWSTCPEPKSETAVQISDVTYTELHGTSASKEAINLSCDYHFHCRNVIFNHVSLTSDQTPTASCQNAHGTSVDTVPRLRCLKPY